MGDAQGRSTERETDPGFLILASLVDGPKHGYAMIDDIDAFAGVRLSSGTLYGAIARLARRGLIDPLASQDRRQLYRLTAAGAEIARARFALLAEMASLERFRGVVTLPMSRSVVAKPAPVRAPHEGVAPRSASHPGEDPPIGDC